MLLEFALLKSIRNFHSSPTSPRFPIRTKLAKLAKLAMYARQGWRFNRALEYGNDRCEYYDRPDRISRIDPYHCVLFRKTINKFEKKLDNGMVIVDTYLRHGKIETNYD